MSSGTQHNARCQALVVHCMDFRLRNSLNDYLGARFPEGYDLVSLAGGVKSLIEDGEIDNFELDQLRLSDNFHSPERLVLIQHEDCGAYGGSSAFKDFAEELERQRLELKKAEELLEKKLSQPVEKYLARLSGELIPF